MDLTRITDKWGKGSRQQSEQGRREGDRKDRRGTDRLVMNTVLDDNTLISPLDNGRFKGSHNSLRRR